MSEIERALRSASTAHGLSATGSLFREAADELARLRVENQIRAQEYAALLALWKETSERAEKAEAVLKNVVHRATAVLNAIDPVRSELLHICAEISDEGDRTYFGSTNHPDRLKEIAHELDAQRWHQVMNPLRSRPRPIRLPCGTEGNHMTIEELKALMFRQMTATAREGDGSVIELVTLLEAQIARISGFSPYPHPRRKEKRNDG